MPFVKGQSGNPGGRPKVVGEVQELARSHTADAVTTLANIMRDTEAAPAARVAAANALLDRGYGKPKQAMEHSGPDGRPILAERLLVGDALAIVVAAGHAWATRQRLPSEDLCQVPWVLREPGSRTRAEFQEAIAMHGITLSALPIAFELPSNEAIRTAVEAGAGATAISHLVAEAAVRAGRLHRLEFPFPERPFHAVWRRERHITQATEAFLEQLREDSI